MVPLLLPVCSRHSPQFPTTEKSKLPHSGWRSLYETLYSTLTQRGRLQPALHTPRSKSEPSYICSFTVVDSIKF
ncbi:hypothetical protein OJAV_G00026710 [Oryzias javanicus]|uniref:Uncharacterized protein n=1 Tax=Oryzias javanicus TaxID=123683 RepID=A0A3S2UNK0_ORYJA|nr:hypothetical protein OJAV_G00026710 [Oryzias javanicus]